MIDRFISPIYLLRINIKTQQAYDNGQVQLLLCLYGTIPISYRGVTYNIPIAVWLPLSFPKHPPIIFVTPTNNMSVRMGKHVDLAGKVYHPMIATWHTRSEVRDKFQLEAGQLFKKKEARKNA